MRLAGGTVRHGSGTRATKILRDLADDRHLLFVSSIRKDRKAQQFLGGEFGFRKALFRVAKTRKAFLSMKRYGVVDLRADLGG